MKFFYSAVRNRWLDLVYPTEREATETMKAVGSKPRTRQIRKYLGIMVGRYT
ncbi:hypothetical protein [Sphingomonas sp. NFX23]|uniref:hypothetical protein n=1 Tax=Sphingomonas sp. NFX23 TaxID=2819532 RepID=UPI003CEFC4FD